MAALDDLRRDHPRLHAILARRGPQVAAARKTPRPLDELLAALDRLGRGRSSVLLAGVYTYFNANKLSLALRERGLATAFLCLNPGNAAFKQGHFDLVLDAGGDLDLFYDLLATSPLGLTHFQGWLTLHAFAAAAAALSRAPLVVEFNDLAQLAFHEADYDRLFGPGAFEEEAFGVSQCLRLCSGAVFNCDDPGEVLATCPAPPPHITFHSYPHAPFFADAESERPARDGDGPPLSVVFAGTVNPSNYPAQAFGDVQLLGLIDLLTARGVGFHLFPNPYQNWTPRGQFWDYEYLAARRPDFVIHPGTAPDELPRAIAGLGYGVMFHLFPPGFCIRLDGHFRHMMPTKFFSYLEAGLPVLVSREMEAVARQVRENGLGLCLAQEDLPRLPDLLRATDFAALRRNVLAYRERMRLSGQVGRLLDWYGGLTTPVS